MADEATFRARVRRGETLLGSFLNLGSPMAAELCGQAGFDWLLLDLEHGILTEADLLHALQAVAATPAAAVVRVEEGTRLRVGRALDMGAPALMVPRVDTPEAASQIARFVRYQPVGLRGVALPTRGAGYGTLTHAQVADAHEQICLFIQIESREALDAADEIASIEGVDVLFVGPSDLSHALGVPGEIDSPQFRRAVERVGRAAADQGKAAGVLLWSLDDMPPYADAGYRLLAVGSDGAYVASAARAVVTNFRRRVED